MNGVLSLGCATRLTMSTQQTFLTRARFQLTGTPLRKVEHDGTVIFSLCVYHRSVKLVTKHEEFIHVIASHVSAVTKMIIRISW